MNDEPIFYQPNETIDPIAVKIDEETVWLTQLQMATLFNQTKQNISLHIVNCFRENELDPNSVVKDSLTTAKDGKSYRAHYNFFVPVRRGGQGLAPVRLPAEGKPLWVFVGRKKKKNKSSAAADLLLLINLFFFS